MTDNVKKVAVSAVEKAKQIENEHHILEKTKEGAGKAMHAAKEVSQ